MQTMATSLKDLLNQQHRRLLKARTLYRILATDVFQAAYSNATDVDREVAEKLIRKADKSALQSWIKQQLMHDYGSYSLRDLRELGRKLGIPYFSRKDKATLLSEITQHEQSRCPAPSDPTSSRTAFIDS